MLYFSLAIAAILVLSYRARRIVYQASYFRTADESSARGELKPGLSTDNRESVVLVALLALTYLISF